MTKYGKVAVVMGGDSIEREVSLMSGEAVLKSLIKSGIDAHKFDPKEESLFNLKNKGFNRAFLVTHGPNGEDGVLQGALEYLNIPYTGSGVLASALAMDKYRTKLIWHKLDIPMAKHQFVLAKGFDYKKFELQLDLPVVVKPAAGGSTLGLSKVYDLNRLEEAFNLAFRYSNSVLIEELIVGDEYTIAISDGKAYPIVKIEAPSSEYDYEHKYFSDDTKYICPYDLGHLQKKLEQFAISGYHALGAKGVSRLDFMIDKDNQIYFLELNTIPGMTAHSLLPMSFMAAGIDFDGLCLHILDGASLDG